MKSFASRLLTCLLVDYLAFHAYGQSTTVSDLPQCGQNCFNVMYNEYGRSCPTQADAACFCSQPGFNPDMTSCISQQCTNSVDSQSVTSFVQTYCAADNSTSSVTVTGSNSISIITPTTSFFISDTATSFPDAVTVLSTRVPIPFSNGTLYPTRSSFGTDTPTVVTVSGSATGSSSSGTDGVVTVTPTGQTGPSTTQTTGPATPVSSLVGNAASNPHENVAERVGLLAFGAGLVALFV